jgi:hypothetical protein
MKTKTGLFSTTIIITALCAAVLILPGCAGYGLTSNHAEVNQMIADANTNRFKAFSEGMAACNDNAACQVGLAMGFSANLGQQAFFKPETTSDLLHAFLPYATLGVDVARLWRMAPTNGDSNGGFIITGDNNQLSGIGNKLTADNQSSVTGTFDTEAKIEHLVYTQDSTQSSSNGTGSVENVENQQDHDNSYGDVAIPKKE